MQVCHRRGLRPCIHRLFPCGACDLVTRHTDNEPLFCLVPVPIGWTHGTCDLVYGRCDLWPGTQRMTMFILLPTPQESTRQFGADSRDRYPHYDGTWFDWGGERLSSSMPTFSYRLFTVPSTMQIHEANSICFKFPFLCCKSPMSSNPGISCATLAIVFVLARWRGQRWLKS
jgi:hypothetical protein